MALAEEGSTAIGMAFGILPRDRPGIPHLGGMWVDPEARRRAVGRALADAVIEWARARGFMRIALWATEGNRPAIALYEQVGFSPTGRTDRLTSNPALAVFEMERPL